MDDKDILGNIDTFIAEEHELRAKAVGAPGLSEAEHARLRELEVRLDQCWDLLRQRRAKSEFGRPLVNSCLTLSIVVGMSVSDVSQKAIGNLGWNDIKLTAPVFVGDTIYAESEILNKRESAKRPTQGVVSVKTLGKKADGTQFMSFERTVLVPKRGHGVDDKANY